MEFKEELSPWWWCFLIPGLGFAFAVAHSYSLETGLVLIWQKILFLLLPIGDVIGGRGSPQKSTETRLLLGKLRCVVSGALRSYCSEHSHQNAVFSQSWECRSRAPMCAVPEPDSSAAQQTARFKGELCSCTVSSHFAVPNRIGLEQNPAPRSFNISASLLLPTELKSRVVSINPGETGTNGPLWLPSAKSPGRIPALDCLCCKFCPIQVAFLFWFSLLMLFVCVLPFTSCT